MKQKRQKHRHHTIFSLPFVFTPETIAMTREALKLLEQPLQQNDSQDEKMVFAQETWQQILDKLDLMSSSIGHLCLTTFDVNEKVILVAAIQLYMFDLLALPLNHQRARKLQACRRIVAYFAPDQFKANNSLESEKRGGTN
jgi:hypothetical protein